MSSDLTNSVENFWNFLWPSVLNLTVISLIILWLLPGTLGRIRSLVSHDLTQRFVAFLTSRTAKAFGLAQLAPATCLFVLLLLMVIANHLASFVGDALPPVFLYESPADYVQVVDEDELLRVWKYYPGVTDPEVLGADIKLLGLRHLKGSGYEFWQEREGATVRLENRAKFCALLVLVCTIIAFRTTLPKGTLVLRSVAVLLVLGAVFGASVLYEAHAHRKLVQAEVLVADRWLSTQPVPAASADERADSRQEVIKNLKETEVTWWRLGLPDWAW